MAEYDSFDAILHHIFKQTQGEAWFKPWEENLQAGVALRLTNNPPVFRIFPYENLQLAPFEAAVRALNPLVAVKINSASVHAALSFVPESQNSIFVDADTRIQVLETMEELAHAEKDQSAAFIRDERVLICWSDNLNSIIPTCKEFDDKLIDLVWRNRPKELQSPSRVTSSASLAYSDPFGSKAAIQDPNTPTPNSAAPLAAFPADTKEKESVDSEAKKPSKRPTKVIAALINGLGCGVSLFFIGGGVRMLIMESLLDGQWNRLALAATSPLLFCVSLFFSISLVGGLFMIVGPVAQYHENSRYYSGVKPEPNPEVDAHLPHITIQMPVYKESLSETIAPSCESLKKAMQMYARQGGTSNIMICDDGMQLIPPEKAEERRRYYAEHGIGYIARPGHSDKPDGYKRAGRFKKASNMNYSLELSLRMEKFITKFQADEQALESARYAHEIASEEESFTGSTEKLREEGVLSLEEVALKEALKELQAETGFKGWAANGRACRVGEIILIVDSDTVVPEDCLRDAAREMAESPDVAIIQHQSDVMQVDHKYFENGIAHFTRRINKVISFVCASGDVAAFVGHNAFLRWSALQDVAFLDENGQRKIWSENNVSEDFDMALRVQLGGYGVRWASYSKGGFKEGVSLTCDDELNRWEKYSFGCSELIFHPFKDWFKYGPVNGQLHSFIWGPAPIHYKVSMLAYCFSYYGIAAAFPMTVLNYLLLGWQLPIGGYYLESFGIWIAVSAVFIVLGVLSFSILEYRLGHRALLSVLGETLMWVPFFIVFFGGLSIHVSKAILAHMFSYNIQWGATKKEVERSNFFLEVPKILKRFRVALVLCLLTTAGMIVLALPFIPVAWQINPKEWSVIFPLALTVASHVAYPILLNPWLMIFSY